MRALTSLALILVSAGSLRADPAATALSVDGGASKLVYQIIHKLHKVSGTSNKVDGKGRILPDGKAQVMLRVPVESFDSGNANRDAHMKETVEAARYPTVELKAAADALALPTSFPSTVEKTFQGELSFHGVKKALALPVRLVFESAERIHVTSHFAVSLDEFKIERPSLMFVKVDDAAQIDVDMVLKK